MSKVLCRWSVNTNWQWIRLYDLSTDTLTFNKFYYKAASWWYFYWVTYAARIHECQIARSLFVRHLHMPVYVVAVTVQAGTFLPPTQVSCHKRFVKSVLSALKVRLYHDPTLLQYVTLLAGRLTVSWPTHVRIVFMAEALYVYCSRRRFPMWERHPTIDHVLSPQSRHSLHRLVAHLYMWQV
jgi:hypothetical protein